MVGVMIMKFISWNVNGLRAVLSKGFEDIFKQLDADFFCLQETKCQPDQVDLSFDGYYQFFNSAERKGYSSTAIFSRKKPLSVSYDFDDMTDHPKEGRIITLEFEKFYLVTAYVPNSKDQLLRIDYRLQWEQAMVRHLNSLKQKKAVIYCGDLNVAHNEIDLKNPDINHFNAGFSDQEREAFTNLLSNGYIDTYRFLYPDKVEYSWWSYRSRAREKNIGWRIDYFVVSEDLKDKIIEAKIHNQIYGSDHCPVELDIEYGNCFISNCYSFADNNHLFCFSK